LTVLSSIAQSSKVISILSLSGVIAGKHFDKLSHNSTFNQPSNFALYLANIPTPTLFSSFGIISLKMISANSSNVIFIIIIAPKPNV